MKVDSFRGVDFASSPVNVANGRSPNAVNLISDLAGKPMKRTGYKVLGNLTAQINGIYRLKTNNFEKVLVHSGTNLYEWNISDGKLQEGASVGDGLTSIYSSMENKRSSCVQFNNKLWLMDGKKLLVYGEDSNENFSVQKVEDIAYVPTTIIGANPDGSEGLIFEDGNLLNSHRKNSFYVSTENASVKVFELDKSYLSSDSVIAQVLKEGGSWQTINEGNGLSVNRTTGQVTFTTAPGASPNLGEDNVVIEFAWVSNNGGK